MRHPPMHAILHSMNALDYLAALRKRGLTQEEISRRCGVPQSTLSRIETGTTRNVMLSTYLALQSLCAEMRIRVRPS